MPAIIRGIYAYHTQSRGWSDIGYNFLVDRFGRIWEGRYGGVDRPVVGAHTLGYNDDSFAMSAIGNFDIAQPPAAMLDAYGRLFAWKLSPARRQRRLHARSGSTKRYLQAINGHRDVGQTACPGQVPLRPDPADPAARRGLPEVLRQPEPHRRTSPARPRPDLVLRDKTTKQGYVLRTGGQSRLHPGLGRRAPGCPGVGPGRRRRGRHRRRRADLLARTRSTRQHQVLAGDGAGTSAPATRPTQRFAAADQLTGVGDLEPRRPQRRRRPRPHQEAALRLPRQRAGRLRRTHRCLSLRWGGYT